MSAHQPSAGFTFWERGALNQFASQAAKALSRIIEITDNNNPASVMHDNPREALSQVHVIALGFAVDEKCESAWTATAEESPPVGERVFWRDINTNMVGYDTFLGEPFRFNASHWMRIPK